MSIQVKPMEVYRPAKAESRQINLLNQIDFETVYALVSNVIIWGGFILMLWSFTAK